MRKKMHVVLTNVLVVWTVVSLLGCSLSWQPMGNPTVSEDEMIPVVARVVEQQMEIVQPVLEEHGEFGQSIRTVASDASGRDIVAGMLEEEQGSDYLAFSHAVATGTDSARVLAAAERLVPEEDFTELSSRVAQVKRSFAEYGEIQSRALPPSQRPAFMRDLQKLLTKTLVLMVAGIVYACIPNTIFWGKITAASAIAVAAGVTATTLLAIYRYYKYGENSASQSFQEWIVDVTTDPTAAYAVATSMMTVGKTMANGPVVTGVILVVFSIYQVMDMVKPMLKKYNFDA